MHYRLVARVVRFVCIVFSLFLAFVSQYSYASGNTIPVALTCAGISGIMRSGNHTYPGAAAESYGMPYKFGTQFRLENGSIFTIEDTLAPYIAPTIIDANGNKYIHFDLYLGIDANSCMNFGVQLTEAVIINNDVTISTQYSSIIPKYLPNTGGGFLSNNGAYNNEWLYSGTKSMVCQRRWRYCYWYTK